MPLPQGQAHTFVSYRICGSARCSHWNSGDINSSPPGFSTACYSEIWFRRPNSHASSSNSVQAPIPQPGPLPFGELDCEPLRRSGLINGHQGCDQNHGSDQDEIILRKPAGVVVRRMAQSSGEEDRRPECRRNPRGTGRSDIVSTIRNACALAHHRFCRDLYVDKVTAGFLLWRPELKAYLKVPEGDSPIIWEQASQAVLEALGGLLDSGEIYSQVITLWAQESSQSEGKPDIRNDHVQFIKSLGASSYYNSERCSTKLGSSQNIRRSSS